MQYVRERDFIDFTQPQWDPLNKDVAFVYSGADLVLGRVTEVPPCYQILTIVSEVERPFLLKELLCVADDEGVLLELLVCCGVGPNSNSFFRLRHNPPLVFRVEVGGCWL